MDDQPKPLRRFQAAELIRAKFSIPCSERTLAKYASKGGGPLYRYSGRFPVYDVADLMAWGAGKVGPKVGTFSEAREASAA
jgi:hypothetical protein